MTPALAQAYALRMQIDALVMALEAAEGVAQPVQPEAGSCPQCGASSDHVVDNSTLDGTKRSRCTNCGAKWER